MSFATEVKKELINIKNLKPCCKKALLFGILVNSSEIILSSEGKRIVLKTTIPGLFVLVKPLLKELYNIETSLSYQEEASLKKRKFYRLEITNKVQTLIDEFKLLPISDIKFNDPLIKQSCCKQAWLRGTFIAKGSINDPRKERYHFEISSTKLSVINIVLQILNKAGITAKTCERSNRYVCYVKRCEQISNTLAYLGADSGVFYFEDQRIVRDVANMANRMTNCDIANEIKCAKKCDEQLSAIKYLRENNIFEHLPIRLQTTALLREEYPDSSYEELSMYSENLFGKQLSKSGISHCFNALMKYYNDIVDSKDTIK